MLGKGYIKINNETIPNPTVLNISNTNIETVKQSETGHDVGNVTRLGKRTFQLTFQSTSRGRDKIRAFCLLSSCQMTYKSETMTGRLRIGSEKLFSGSEFAPRTEGLWTLTVNFIEE